VPNLQIAAARSNILSQQQMQQQAVVWREPTNPQPDASGGVASARTPDSEPIGLRVIKATDQDLAMGGELQGRTPDAAVRVPLGTGLVIGDELHLVGGPVYEVLGVRPTVTFGVDQRVLVGEKGTST
jgi:superfamily II DNA or RNA helicase